MDKGFSALVDMYKEKLYWHIRRMVVFHEDADDVLQNTFIKIYKNILKFKADAKLYTWLYRIATNESITHLNKKKKQYTRALEGDDNFFAEKLKADQYFDGDDALRHLELAMNTLPEKQKAVFQLRYYEEMPYKEMEKVLDTSVGALKASYHHAVKKIENYLKSNMSYAK
jgi:RNA polymerase sigma-70 factor (ECF subfamily)